jgi:hypothetical protein
LKRDAGRLYASFGASIERWDFQNVKARDGSIIDQEQRDMQIGAANTMLGYRFSPGYEMQAKLRVLRQDNFGPTTTNYSAYGYEVLAGVAAEINPLLRWRLLAATAFATTTARSSARPAMAHRSRAPVAPDAIDDVHRQRRRAYSEASTARRRRPHRHRVRRQARYEVLRNLVFTIGGEYRASDFFG